MNNRKRKDKRRNLLLAAVTAAGLAASSGAVRFCADNGLSFRGMMAMAGYSGLNLPEWFCRFVLGGERTYRNLPEILKEQTGKPVLSLEHYKNRREELVQMYQTYMYGELPTKESCSVSYRQVEEGEAFGGKGRRSQIEVIVSANEKEISAMLLIYRPEGRSAKGFFIGENFTGNTAVSTDNKIRASVRQNHAVRRGSDRMFPVERILEAGYGFATMYYKDWENDGGNPEKPGILEISGTTDSTAFTAWAYGLIRAVDYLKSAYPDEAETIAVVGHSRLARAALWAGALDERIDLTINSCGGGYMRGPIIGKVTERDKQSNWTTAGHDAFFHRDHDLPVDMNVLYALIAKRRLYISMGDSDLAADPYSMLEALQNAKEVWRRIYGMEVIEDCGYYDVPKDQMIMSDAMGYHIHTGGHETTSLDWEYYIRYMEYTSEQIRNYT